MLPMKEKHERSELSEREGHLAEDIKGEVLANKYRGAFSKQEETEGIIPWLNQDGSKKAALSSIPILENECKCMADYYIRLPIAWQTPHGEMACTHVFFFFLSGRVEKDHKSRASHTGRRSRFFIFSGVREKGENLKEAPPVLQRAPRGEQGLLPCLAYSVLHSISSKKGPPVKVQRCARR